jgi:hypothetical protein
MNSFLKYAVGAFSIALLLPATSAVAEATDQAKSREEAIRITRWIEDTSRKIQLDSERLISMQRSSTFTNQSHKVKLQRIAHEINSQLQPAFKRLAELQPELPEWKQSAIDQMHTSALALAANTHAAILNRNSTENVRPPALDFEYREFVQDISNHADSLVQIADAASDYSTAQLRGHQAGLPIASHN